MSVGIRGLEFAHPQATHGLKLNDLHVPSGTSLAVIGPSGSGKTTFLNILSGLVRPSAGSVNVAGTEVDALSGAGAEAFRAKKIGYVFQDFGLLEYLSALDNILHPFRICRGRRLDGAARDAAVEIAASLGIADRLSRRPAQLSHGERQRVAICRAVVTEPAVILADEPTGNLDPDTATHILGQLMDTQRRLSSTLIVVTHDHGLLDRFDAVLDFRDCWGPVA